MTKVAFRPIQEKDRFDYLRLLKVFGDTDLTDHLWSSWFETYDESDNREIIIGEITDVNLGIIVVCTASIIYEQKVYHSLGIAAHVEDVVVDEKYRGLGIGKELIKFIIKSCETMGCYKIILNCKEKNCEFYSKCGFTSHEICMRKNI